MEVVVKLFAGLRERAGTGERTLELPEGARVADVWAPLELGELPAGLLYAVNRAYAPVETPLAAGDEVALIPPVSGGAFRLTEEPIDPSAVIREVSDPRAGGIATFIGTTRVESRGRTVHYLDYEAYGGMAEQVMAELADELKRKHDLCEVAITHRVGRVDIGELSVVIAVSAPHRAAALTACQEAIDTLKQSVPLWKKEVYEGGEEWIGRGS
jgi:molybdopterin synthase catalytic subunit/molybdopterin converting factor small subunit